MKHIKFFKNIKKTDVEIAGGKGASLGEMSGAGIAVPPGFVVLANACDRFVEETNLNGEIKARLSEVDPEDTNSIDKASNVLRDVIHDTPMPKDLEKEILEAFDELFGKKTVNGKILNQVQSLPSTRLGDDNCRVAVRSSATAEDGAIASWAGELDTFLNTTRENVLVKVRECWSSLFTPRAIFYRHEKGLIDEYVSVAVVIQKMVQSDIAGIAFTVHPVTEDPNQMIIEAGFGLGEAVVSGQVTPDSYIVSKDDMSIFDINVGHQTQRLDIKKGKLKEGEDTNKWVELNKEDGEKQKLTGRQIIEVAEVCKIIEEHYKFPCDIEWAIEDKKIYITQSRPITTLK